MLSDAARLYNSISTLHAALVDAGLRGDFELRLSADDGAQFEHMVTSGGTQYRGEVVEPYSLSPGERAMDMSGIRIVWPAGGSPAHEPGPIQPAP
ncbi:hypothetical protein [Rhodoligotrophos defluvii]|uniref:hypothetical protein n=1 Tax=Rhodoligotrophos defluvii TaxID=2561934 RepID=UPI0010C9E57F|nr:hypothetical protein [Rhodoligotrophos defluvii]